MTSQEYFDILGIHPTKDEAKIRKAYHKKALKYHPDRNQTKEAHERFILINEAYRNLTLAIEQDREYSSSSVASAPSPKTHKRDENLGDLEERMKRARARYEYIQRKEAEDLANYYKNLTTGVRWRVFLAIMVFSTFMASLLFLDYSILPPESEYSYITKNNVLIQYNGLDGEIISPIVLDNGEKIWVPVTFSINYQQKDFLIERTSIFKDIKRINYQHYNSWESFKPNYSISVIYPLILIILLFPLFTFFIKKPSIGFMISMNICFYLFPFILAAILISGDRWWNLITLGMTV